MKTAKFIVFGAILFSGAASALDFIADFETGQLGMGRCSGNCPTVTTKHVRAGKYAMESYLNRLTSPKPNRTEVVLPGTISKMEFNRDYWIGFSIFLPTGWEVPDPRFEILAQIHSTLDDSDVGGSGPPFSINTGTGNWRITSRGYGVAEKNWVLNNVMEDVNKWVDWVIHIKPSYTSTGVLEVWKNGVLVAQRSGPNTYQDKVGPYLKLGLYIGWKNRNCCAGKSPEKWVYHDELRVASGPTAKYSDVAPPASPAPPQPVALPKPASSCSITSPAEGALVSGIITATVDATDPDGVSRVELWAGEEGKTSTKAGTDYAAPYIVALDTKPYNRGSSVNLRAIAFDRLGHPCEATRLIRVK